MNRQKYAGMKECTQRVVQFITVMIVIIFVCRLVSNHSMSCLLVGEKCDRIPWGLDHRTFNRAANDCYQRPRNRCRVKSAETNLSHSQAQDVAMHPLQYQCSTPRCTEQSTVALIGTAPSPQFPVRHQQGSQAVANKLVIWEACSRRELRSMIKTRL